MRRRTLILLILVFFVYLSSLLVTLYPFDVSGRTYVYSSKITYINHGEEAQSLDADLRTFGIFMNISWQTAYLEKVSGAYTLAWDSDGNPVIVLNLSPLPPGGNVTVSYSLRLEEKVHSPPEINFASSGYLRDIPEELREEYCRPEGSWVANEDLRSLANKIWASQGNTTNVLKIATGIANWVGSNITSASHDIPYYPHETYSNRTGDCDDQANLLIALCRSLEVPAYLQVGALKWSSKPPETYWDGRITSNLKDVTYHAWAMVYVPPWGWLPFDMTLEWSSGDPLSVVKSAKVWSLDAMPMLNVTRSDWAGEGRAQKMKIMAGSIYIHYEDALTTQDQEGIPHVLTDWRLWSVVAVILSVSIVAEANYSKRIKTVKHKLGF